LSDPSDLPAVRLDPAAILSAFYGIVIWMYYDDHNPPHFHATYAEHEAIIDIASRRVLRGSLPARSKRLVDEADRLTSTR